MRDRTLADRLRSRARQLGLSPARIAELAGVNGSFVRDILRGRSLNPGPARLDRVAEVLNVSREWLLHGVGEIEGATPVIEDPDETFVGIQHIGARVTMGEGRMADGAPGPGRDYRFRRGWIREELRASPSQLRIMVVEGDSMAPTLRDGDTVMIDLTRTSPNPPGIFVLHDGGGLVAKRVENIPGCDPPRVRILSDNPLYAPHEAPAAGIRILGRVRWLGREF